jgi:hypothetical protein
VSNVETESGMSFESIMFRGPVTEISFSEPHDRSEGVVQIRTMVADGARVCPVEHTVFMVALVEFVEALQLALRSPPEDL